ncbi:mannose-6-phosphate isomerase, class I [Homoserinimonas sp. OAct 916]|uniref:mannose-6-phosphate isomerase, class I n=1 Tax=Homoserinimonas sp. OAct 916 TaxID=2211450 RepID=UPI000DBE5BF7|nr:mannose-6-phosphate isomerase, class I [Homoserinimonas sp. OAct 916]
MYELTGIPRNYAWGSTTQIQQLLGLPQDGGPLAEVWFGAHPTDPSGVTDEQGRQTTLDRLIDSDPARLLGRRSISEFGPTLPFLMKFLAPGEPVSLQVHPTPANAHTGFIAEQIEGVPIDAPHRSFKDTNHKPEMVFALTEFSGLVGFRDPALIVELLAAYNHPALRGAHRLLAAEPGPAGMKECLRRLVELGAAEVDQIVAEATQLSANGPEVADAHQMVAELAQYFPGDAGCVASLMLVHMRFRPGDCLFVPSGIPHAYLSGLCVEVMANSDNVFRAGLTNKYVDVEGLLANTRFDPTPLAMLPGDEIAPGVRVLSPEAAEFALTVVTCTSGGEQVIAGSGPRIAVCVDGLVTVRAERATAPDPLSLPVGGALFAADVDGDLTVAGHGLLVIASVP